MASECRVTGPYIFNELVRADRSTYAHTTRPNPLLLSKSSLVVFISSVFFASIAIISPRVLSFRQLVQTFFLHRSVLRSNRLRSSIIKVYDHCLNLRPRFISPNDWLFALFFFSGVSFMMLLLRRIKFTSERFQFDLKLGFFNYWPFNSSSRCETSRYYLYGGALKAFAQKYLWIINRAYFKSIEIPNCLFILRKIDNPLRKKKKEVLF